ncbi:7121_t:CDS:2, partial [Racocetra fulgida]
STGGFDLNALLYHVFTVNNKPIMITQNIGERLDIEPKISDLGISSRIDEINVDGGTYGVVQYVADEVLLVYKKLREWKIILDKGIEELNEDNRKIKNAFLKTDEIIFSQLQWHPDATKCASQLEADISQFGIPQRDSYTSKLIIPISKLLNRE